MIQARYRWVRYSWRGAAGSTRGSPIDSLGLRFSSCTGTCSSSRVNSRSRCAGRARRARCCRRAAGAVVGVLDRLLPHRLSHIDPIANDLFLNRFLNEELNSLPDIDLDFPRDVREKLIPRVHDRYGKERSALVAAFPTFRSRGAIRSSGKVLGLPPGSSSGWRAGPSRGRSRAWAGRRGAMGIEPRASRARSSIPTRADAFAMSTSEWLAMVNGKRPDKAEAHETDPSSPAYDRLPGGGRGSRGCATRPTGCRAICRQHSGGMIVSTRPLIDCCPVLPAAMEGRQLCQWDKDSCADAGFLKIDLLGLGMLSAVERCVEEIGRVRGERVDLSRIPYDDKPTYDAIQVADTMGVFQIESRAQMASLLRTRPHRWRT